MSRDDASPNRAKRFLGASWPFVRTFGTEVRASWTSVAAALCLFWLFVTDFSQLPEQGGKWTWSLVGLHWQEAAAWALAWTAALLFAAWLHEMAHVAAARVFGVHARRVLVSPFGGVAHAATPGPSPLADFWTALAGPAAQIALTALLAAPWFIFDMAAYGHAAVNASGFGRWPAMYEAFTWVQLAVAAFGLLPVFPLDGGRCLYAAFAARLTPVEAARWTTYVGYPGAMMLSIGGAWMLFNPEHAPTNRYVALAMIAVGLTSFLHCRRLQVEANAAVAAFEPPPAWKNERPSAEPWKDGVAESERLSRAEERRERLAAQARHQEELEHRRIQERIDELLDRINEVGGVENLTPAERRELAEASESLRRETAGR